MGLFSFWLNTSVILLLFMQSQVENLIRDLFFYSFGTFDTVRFLDDRTAGQWFLYSRLHWYSSSRHCIITAVSTAEESGPTPAHKPQFLLLES